MPFILVNGANIYYETFGVDTSGHAPIVLIHGSIGTGRSNWSLVAPLLARSHRVIVPDCRGHGQSGNPNQSYSLRNWQKILRPLSACLVTSALTLSVTATAVT